MSRSGLGCCEFLPCLPMWRSPREHDSEEAGRSSASRPPMQPTARPVGQEANLLGASSSASGSSSGSGSPSRSSAADEIARGQLVIQDGLRQYSERPSPAAFMQVYNQVFMLIMSKSTGDGSARALHELFCSVSQASAKSLYESVDACFAEGRPTQECLDELVQCWRSIRNGTFVQLKAMGIIDRKLINDVAPCEEVARDSFQNVGMDGAEVRRMWSGLSGAIEEAGRGITTEQLRQLVVAWHNLGPPARPLKAFVWRGFCAEGLEDVVAGILRSHLVATITSNAEHDQRLPKPVQDVFKKHVVMDIVIAFCGFDDLLMSYGVCTRGPPI
mmetsp:Transcript_44451/g.96667  ORF Transcript_44451/g.96667 Transcript_44451/m.96667 type:complete len:330 (-) Transcript_44451:114-1103(-)